MHITHHNEKINFSFIKVRIALKSHHKHSLSTQQTKSHTLNQ